MPDLILLYDWLIRAAATSLVILTAGSLAVVCCRQPARRLVIIGLTLSGCLVAPWLGLLSDGGWPGPGPSGRAPILEQRSTQPLSPGHTASGTPETLAANRPAESAESIETRLPAEPPAREFHAEAPAAPGPQTRLDLRRWVAGCYLLGVASLCAWSLVGLLGLARLQRRAAPAADSCRTILREVAGPHADRVRLLISDRLRQPVTWTFTRPVIALPSALVSAPQQQLRWVLAHEWAHIARRDWWTWAFCCVVRIAFFYQPLVWWLARQLRLSQDYLADARASQPDPADYAEFLVRCISGFTPPPPALGLGIGAKPSDLNRRVTMLVQKTRPLEMRCPPRWKAGAVLAACLLVTSVGAFGGSSRQGRAADKIEAPTAPKRHHDSAAADVREQDPKAGADERERVDLRFDGKTFDEWRSMLRTELKPELRIEALEAMGRFGAGGYAEEATAAILDFVSGYSALAGNQTDARVLQSAETALRRIGGAAAPGLINGVEQANSRLQAFAIRALTQAEIHENVSNQIRRTIVEKFINAFDADASEVRMRAADVFNRQFDPGNVPVSKEMAAVIVPALERALKDSEPRVRAVAAQALGRFGSTAKSAIPELLAATQDQSYVWDVRYRAIASLRKLHTRPEVFVPVLVKALQDENQNVQRTAIAALGELGPAAVPAVPALMEAYDKNPVYRRDIGNSLVDMGPAAVPALITALDEASLNNKWVIIDALREIGPAAAPAVPSLLKLQAELSDPRLEPSQIVENRKRAVAEALKAIQGEKQ